MCSAKRVKRDASVCKEPVEAFEEGFCEKQVGIEDNESVEGEGQKKVDSPKLATISAVVERLATTSAVQEMEGDVERDNNGKYEGMIELAVDELAEIISESVAPRSPRSPRRRLQLPEKGVNP